VSAAAAQRAVILDRDGTIVVDRGYLDDPAQLRFLPGAAEGLRLWHERGHPLVIVSNQSGIGRGRLSLQRAREVNARLLQMIEAAGARIAGVYFCPHRPEDGCACRKPAPQLLLEAAAALGFDPQRALVIGDKSSDIELGRRVHALTMLVSQDGRASDGLPCEPDYVVSNLLEAARLTSEPCGNPAHAGRVEPVA
jgi:D-glycero-D-manno-heptose 1,7-bisphosphate phosphatase